MKKMSILLLAAATASLFSGCGLSIYEDWKKSGGKAITGAGAIAGKDYVTGLTPSENSRKYFARISGDNRPIETVRRSDEGESKSGVKFVKNGGILIPPGVTISFENKGYCMDPNLPAPKAGDEYQLVPMTQLIPEDLQGMYKKLVAKASAGDESVQRNMQHLVWALRTAGTEAAYANNLTKEQKKILDRCGEYPGQFEEFNANAKKNKALKELIGMADSFLNVKIGGVSYKASDLLDPDVGNKKINEHIDQLIGMSAHLPVEKSGFNFGEIQPGIYTDVQGTGYMQYRARIANSTNQPFIFYPTDYVGQVGSPTKNGGMATYAAANTTMRQRVTGGNPDDVKAQGEPKPEEPEEEKKCPPHSFCMEYTDDKGIKRQSDIDDTRINDIQENLPQIRNFAKGIADKLRDYSQKTGKEFGVVIYESGGKIQMSNISVGDDYINSDGKRGSAWSLAKARQNLPEDAKVLAMVHSHPPFDGSGFSNQKNAPDIFSAEDFAVGYSNLVNVYLASPINDNVWEFTPYDNKVNHLSGKGHNGSFSWNVSGDTMQEDEKKRFRKNFKVYCKKCGLPVTL